MKPGGADRYENLEVRIVHGHNPDLVVTEPGGAETRRLDLTQYPTDADLHALVLAEGFALRADASLQNKHEK